MSKFYISPIYKSPSIISTIKVKLEIKDENNDNESSIKDYLIVVKGNIL